MDVVGATDVITNLEKVQMTKEILEVRLFRVLRNKKNPKRKRSKRYIVDVLTMIWMLGWCGDVDGSQRR